MKEEERKDTVTVHCPDTSETNIHRRTSSSSISTSSSEREWSHDNLWTICCGTRIDKRSMSFFSKLGISISTIAFCFYMLLTSDTCEDQHLYSGILMLVLGIWIKEPVY